MHLILNLNKKGVFLLAFATILIFLLLLFLLYQTKINSAESKTISDFISASALTTHQAVFENNISFLLKETMKIVSEENPQTYNKEVYLSAIVESLSEYLLSEGFSASQNFLDSVDLSFDLAGSEENKTYKIVIKESVSRTFSVNNLKLTVKIPEGFVVGDVID